MKLHQGFSRIKPSKQRNEGGERESRPKEAKHAIPRGVLLKIADMAKKDLRAQKVQKRRYLTTQLERGKN